ncbi:MAG: 3-dehydroquinate synthase [Phascolarctobacterium sp.]|uniref:3-dehydroquinate synthase n=1 Tax=Phascolarctobacterium sp. TaxID=2049039 RepID=UPI0026DB6763|nr:3-dehydroquinate synthase [Phascolarctobacterium sp.]MDO4921646.1 3-dehydroquinate synthase [Phascolarctobacterium sp.]
MQKIHVDLGPHAYDIEIAAGMLPGVGAKVAALLPKARKAAIISDSNVAPLYADALADSLAQAGLAVQQIVFPAGEQSKNITVLSRVLEELAQGGLTRSDVVLTLGGGVVGDLGGFAAASYMRGVAFVQVPTSLLAQIDSSVGGKVAVDLQAGKNLAGAFYQPKAVFIDTDLLATLPVRFLHDGLAEAVKYGCIKDAALFEKLAGFADDAELLRDIGSVVANCCAIKARIVEQDEFDTGLRMLLNFGHTLGHAVEQHFGYSHFTHGEGVAIGMYQLTQRTEAMGLTAPGTAERIKNVLLKYGLPLTAGVDKSLLLDAMARDKKKNGSSITLIVLKNIGEGTLRKLEWRQVPEYLG